MFMSLANAPGEIQFTQIFLGASSLAMLLVKCIIPAFEAEYGNESSKATPRPSIEEMLIILAGLSLDFLLSASEQDITDCSDTTDSSD